MIYARQLSLPSGVTEIFGAIGISPFRCEVIVQLQQPQVSGEVLYLAEDSEGTNRGPALETTADDNGTALVNSIMRFCTDKDPVYLYAAEAVTVGVALVDHP